MDYVIFDLEWNQCPYGKGKENPKLPFEIIEIGAVKMDGERNVVGTFHRIVKPVVYQHLHHRTREVVGLTEEDLQNGSYNAFALSRRLTAGDAAALGEARRYAEGSLNATLAECEAAYNLLDIRRFDGILRNVLELGLPYVQKQALFGDPQSKSGKRRKREDPNYD